MKPIAESLDAIRGSIHEANKALIEREQYKDAHQERGEHDQLIEYYVERAFTQLLVLLETRNLEQIGRATSSAHSRNCWCCWRPAILSTRGTPWSICKRKLRANTRRRFGPTTCTSCGRKSSRYISTR